MNNTPAKHIARVSAFRCQGCGKVSVNPTDFREIIGNVNIPDEGGLIGNNFIVDRDTEELHLTRPEPRGEPTMMLFERTPSSIYRQLNVYSTILCIPCFLQNSRIDGATESHEDRPLKELRPTNKNTIHLEID